MHMSYDYNGSLITDLLPRMVPPLSSYVLYITGTLEKVRNVKFVICSSTCIVSVVEL